MFTKIKKKFDAKLFAMILASVAVLEQVGFCTEGSGVSVSGIVDVVLEIFKYAGMVILIVGIGKFALAIKDENGPGQSQGILFCASGAILMGLSFARGLLGLS